MLCATAGAALPSRSRGLPATRPWYATMPCHSHPTYAPRTLAKPYTVLSRSQFHPTLSSVPSSLAHLLGLSSLCESLLSGSGCRCTRLQESLWQQHIGIARRACLDLLSGNHDEVMKGVRGRGWVPIRGEGSDRPNVETVSLDSEEQGGGGTSAASHVLPPCAPALLAAALRRPAHARRASRNSQTFACGSTASLNSYHVMRGTSSGGSRHHMSAAAARRMHEIARCRVFPNRLSRRCRAARFVSTRPSAQENRALSSTYLAIRATALAYDPEGAWLVEHCSHSYPHTSNRFIGFNILHYRARWVRSLSESISRSHRRPAVRLLGPNDVVESCPCEEEAEYYRRIIEARCFRRLCSWEGEQDDGEADPCNRDDVGG